MIGTIAVFARTRTLEGGPDARAIARCKAGDTDAFAEIVDRYQGMVNSVVGRALRNPDDAADVAQEVFVRAYRSLHTFRADAKFSTWLYRIALNTALRHAGQCARERRLRVEQDPEMPDLLSTLPTDPAEGPEEQAWQRISHERLHKAVHALPDKQRAVIVLHYFEGKSCEEIADILDVNVGTVWSRIHYAVKRLKGAVTEL